MVVKSGLKKMGMTSLSVAGCRQRSRSEIILVRATSRDKRAVCDEAKRNNQTVSEYIRRKIWGNGDNDKHRSRQPVPEVIGGSSSLFPSKNVALMEEQARERTESEHPRNSSNRGVRICNLLAEGHTRQTVMKLIGVSETCVRKHADSLVANGVLARITEKPATYAFKSKTMPSSAPQPAGCAIRTPAPPANVPIFSPHKFGARFDLGARPARLLDRREPRKCVRLELGLTVRWDAAAYKWYIREPGFTVEIGRAKAAIWLKSFVGGSVDEQLKWARAEVERLGNTMARALGVGFFNMKLEGGEHFVMDSLPGSKKLDEMAGLGARGKVIAGARVKMDSWSHPQHIEIEQEPREPRDAPEAVAREIEFLVKEGRPGIAGVKGELAKIKESIAGIERRQSEILTAITGTPAYSKPPEPPPKEIYR